LSFGFRPPATGAAWRRSDAVFWDLLGAGPARFEAGAFCARLRFKPAIRSMTGDGGAISLGFT
jgi:hypothetical protein